MKTDLVTKDLTTTSLALAELFSKNHKDVLRVIRNIIRDISPDDLGRRNFALSSYINEQNKEQPMFIMGEEMTLIITGRLTGKEALAAQMKLADAFISMRNFIQEGQAKLSTADTEMLRLTRISPNTLKAITGNRSNNEVRKGYIGLTQGGYLVDAGKWVWKHNYQPTEKGLECVKAVKHGILHFKPEYHEALMETVANYTAQLTCDNTDLFLEV
jgi:Rha family phage regulatory protein